MRILLIASLAESLLNFRGPLIEALLRQGVDVDVAAPDLPPSSPIRQAMEARGVTVHSLPLSRTGINPLADLKVLWAMYGLMCRIRPDVLLSYTIKPVIYGTLAGWAAKVPRRFALITGLGYAFTGQVAGLRAVVRTVAQNLYKLALRRVQKVFFQNPDDEHLFRHLGLLHANVPSVIVNGSGVDVASFAVAPLPATAPHFLLIARLLGDKGVREFAQAAQQVKAVYPNTRFSLVGWIDENPDAISQAELDEWVQSGTLAYWGRLQDVRPAIAQCSAYVLPSYREGIPRTVLEAMAMGRAIVTTDAPGCRETVVDGDNGFLVPVKCVDGLAQAMQRFIDNPDLIARMGQRSRAIAEEKYDVHKVNAVMLREMGLL